MVKSKAGKNQEKAVRKDREVTYEVPGPFSYQLTLKFTYSSFQFTTLSYKLLQTHIRFLQSLLRLISYLLQVLL